jgi:hypothetical protein
MNLEEIINALNLTVLTTPQDFSKFVPESGYASDLLSCVMAGANHHSLWVTLQAHSNIVAVAALLELSAVIITENAMPDEATIAKANEEGVILLSTPEKTFSIVGKLCCLGLCAS